MEGLQCCRAGKKSVVCRGINGEVLRGILTHPKAAFCCFRKALSSSLKKQRRPSKMLAQGHNVG